ncbi:hypothetical protein LQ318_13475 [Aliifodinibius salicampi]|uniref:Uncharacterized protein n=1 Tax=Fodinibius salicampi TaxID=1920655 RepID=A0ABT3Q1G4_9BACT|nr:hypothetical protein [Fodinibius salicampi]MCW9713916.1 hypothetical protein [Fodinibius salicampi]
MLDLFKPIPVYIKLFSDRIEITRLDNGETISRNASKKFSNSRLVLAHFENAQMLLRSMLSKWAAKILIFQRGFNVVNQQIEKMDDGLSEIERHALTEIAEYSGAKNVHAIGHARKLTNEKARSLLSKSKNT